MGTSTGVKYIGKNAVYEDNILRTGLTWSKGETHILPEVMAKEFLKHPGMFAEVPGASYLIATPSGSGIEPRGIAPSGTVAADGTITLGTALPATFAQIMLYLPAGAISGGSAGFYAVEMSSTTGGVVRERFGGAALVGSGSAYTGVTTEVTVSQSVFSWSQIKGQVLSRAIGLCNNTAGAKTYRARIGATQVNSAAPASQTGFGAMVHLHHVGGPLVSAINALAAGGTNTAAVVTATEGQDVTVSHTLQLAAATDYAILVATLDMVI